VVDFGADPSLPDNSAPFRQAIDQTGLGGALYVPGGIYLFSKDLEIDSPIRFIGASPERAHLAFSEGKGLIVCSYGTSPRPQLRRSGQGSVLEGLRIAGTWPSGFTAGVTTRLPERWQPQFDYHIGDRVTMFRLEADGRIQGFRYFYWECVKAGRSGAQPPSISNSGSFAAKRAMVVDLTTEWQPNQAYVSGQFIRPPGRFDVAFVASDGTSGAVEPPWDAAPIVPDETIQWTRRSVDPHFLAEPSGLTWAVRVHAGIRMDGNCSIRDCLIEGFLNAGLYIASDDGWWPPSNTIGWRVDRLSIGRCGTGVVVQGTRCHYGCATSMMLNAIGNEVVGMPNNLLDWTEGVDKGGNGGVSILDLSYYGNQWISCVSEGSTDRSIVLEGQRQMGTVIGFWEEGVSAHDIGPSVDASSGPVLGDANIVISSYFSQSPDPGSRAARLQFRDMTEVQERFTGRPRRLAELPHYGVRDVRTHLNYMRDGAAVFAWSANWAAGPGEHNAIGWYNRPAGTPQLFDAAIPASESSDEEWQLAYQVNSPAPYIGLTDWFGRLGGGWRDYSGHFCGEPGWEYFLGVGHDALRTNGARHGFRQEGDRFEPNSARLGSRGRYLGKVVERGGFVYRETWTPNTSFDHFNVGHGWPADRIGFDGMVFVCTRGGTSSPNQLAVETALRVAVARRGISLSQTFRRGWRVTPWMPAFYPQLGHIVRVARQGTYYLFMCRRTIGWGRTGQNEPVWNTTPGSTTGDVSQPSQVDVQWLCLGEDPDAAYIVEEPNAGGARVRPQWTCVGPLPALADYGPVYEKASVVTHGSDWTELDRWSLGEEPDVSFVDVTVKARSIANASRAAALALRGAWRREGSGYIEMGVPEIKAWSTASELEARLAWVPSLGAIQLSVRDTSGDEVSWSSLRRPHSDHDRDAFAP
jgi:hypothetical protein